MTEGRTFTATGGLLVASRRSVAALVTGGPGGTGGPAPTWHKLVDFHAEMQTQSNWCWVTLALSVHKYFDRTSQLTQCQVAGHMLNRTDTCANPSSADNNVSGHVYDVLSWLGNSDANDHGEVPLSDLKTQIDAGRPVSTDVWWAGGGGHSVAVGGYASDGTLSIEDPINGTVLVDYTTFTTSYEGDGDWGDSYYTYPNRIAVAGGRANSLSRPALVSRMPSQLDAFVIGTDGHVYTAAWNQGVANGQWQGWWKIGDLAVPADGAVTAVARSSHQLDVFAVGTDGHVYTAAWDQNVSSGQWRGWWPIAGGLAKAGAPVGAVARRSDQLDVFVVGTDGHVYTAAWNQNVANGQWQGWWKIGDMVAPQGGSVTAVARAADQLDIFAVGTDGHVCTAAWNQNVASAKWQGWWGIAGGAATPGSFVGAVARRPDQLDVFVVGTDGRVYTAAWNQNVASGKWQGWWWIANGIAPKGSPVTVASRAPDQLDVFVACDNQIYTAAWNQNIASGKWQGWWLVIQTATAQPTAFPSAVARTAQSLDVLYVDAAGEVSAAAWDQSIASAKWRG